MKKFKKKCQLVLIAVILLCYTGRAQYNVNLLLNNRPPSYLSDWGTGLAGQLLITYSTPIVQTVQVKIATQLQDGSGNIIAASINGTAQIITLNPGLNTIRMDRALQLENLQFKGSFSSLATSGKLLPGDYFLSVNLLNATTNVELTPPQPKPFTQVNYQLPFLLSPGDKNTLDANTAQTAIIFRWSSLIPISQDAPTYRLQVYEVQENQTPMQALRSNQPILLTDVKRTTQYIWRPQLAFKDTTTHQFIWTVQTLDAKGNVITTASENSEGRSEPSLFSVSNKKQD